MIKLDKFIKYLLLTLMLLMPIFDTKFFYSRVTTLTIILIIFLILILTLINNKKSHKTFGYLFIYYILCFAYLIISYLHSKGFTSLVPGNINYNFYLEFTTILKLITPITLLFILKYNNIAKKEYIFIIKYWIVLICGSIIFTNIFKISLSSYSGNTITYNIFEWNNSISYMLTASKGFFNYANQEACIMIILLVTSLYLFFEKGLKNLIYILLLTIAMIMLGTRVSTMGGLLTLITTSLFIIAFKIFKEKKKKLYFVYILIPIIIWILLLPISPYSNRNIELSQDFEEEIVEIETNPKENETIDEKLTLEQTMMKYVAENYIPEKMPERFFKNIYSYEYDPYFWYDLIKKNNSNDINYRMLEINIIKRIKEVDNRITDTLFGISNSRIQNVINIERDFLLQYYAYGIIGMLILLMVYPFLIINIFIKTIKEKNLINILLFIIILLFIFVAYLTGNILNFLTPTIPLIFLVSYVFVNKNEKNN